MGKVGLSAGSNAGERAEADKKLRKSVPRSSHAGWDPPSGRRDPISILEAQETTRVQELVPIRHARMMVSPFTFYRGTAAVMAADLATTPSSGLNVQSCGDAHLSNFGLYASPERNLVFDLNDFDETLPAPFEWDLKRLVTSITICARANDHSKAKADEAARATAASYRHWIRRFASERYLDVWYTRVDFEALLPLIESDKHRKRARKGAAKAKSKTSIQAMEKLTAPGPDGHPVIVDDPPLIVHQRGPGIQNDIREGLEDYLSTVPEARQTLLRRYRMVDGARKVVGVGSVGTACGILLLMGDRDDDPLFLQIKEAAPSVLEPYTAPSRHSHQGERVVYGQRLMQATSDLFLGWVTVRGRDSYVRQLRDMKGSAKLDKLKPKQLTGYGAMCAVTLARAHARSGDAVAIGSYLGKGEVFDGAMVDFANDYADQAKLDYQALVDAVASGRMEARDA
ncbi:MAG: DUF2252 domain-containing protein [Solirubrobacterales bacterium]